MQGRKKELYSCISLSFFPLLPLSSRVTSLPVSRRSSTLLFSPFSLSLSYARYTRYIYALSPVRESGKFLMGVLCGAYQPRFIQEEDILGLSWLANWFCTLILIPRTVGTSARFLPPVVPRGWFSWTSRWAGHPGRLPSLFYLFARHFNTPAIVPGITFDFLKD